MRKFAENNQAHNQTENNQAHKQTENSKPEATLIPCGLWGERANITIIIDILEKLIYSNNEKRKYITLYKKVYFNLFLSVMKIFCSLFNL